MLPSKKVNFEPWFRAYARASRHRARHQLERGFRPGLEREFVVPRMHPVYTDSITDYGFYSILWRLACQV